MTEPPPAAVARAANAVGAAAAAWSPVHRGYAANNERWLVHFDDGSSAFVKAATDEMSTRFVHLEAKMYARRLTFSPVLLAVDPADPPVLVLEDLSGAHWPPPWRAGDVEAVLRTLEAVAATVPPTTLPHLADEYDETGSWRAVAADPEPFLSLSLCSRAWLDAALPALLDATAATPFAGRSLVHCDVRSDNICVFDGRAVLVDWNLASVGNPAFDPAFWFPSLIAESGEPPAVAGTDEFAAFVSGFFASRAGLPPPPTAPFVREIQLVQLRAALPWTCRVLGLPPP